MARVMAVVFERYGQLHYLDPGDLAVTVGDLVLYPTEGGPEVAQCVWAAEDVDFAEVPLCPGLAGEEELARDRFNREFRDSARQTAVRIIGEYGLSMKVLAVDYLDRGPEGPIVAIYYQSPGRVDFRKLVGDLARGLHARVDLRQVGQRDATRLTGGIGQCGLNLCCATWLDDFEPISLRLAKAQELVVNPLAISGQCGRLLCCLRYEQPIYKDFFKRAPADGSWIGTPNGDGKVIGHVVPADAVTVRHSSGEVTRCPLSDVCKPSKRPWGLIPAIPAIPNPLVRKEQPEPVEVENVEGVTEALVAGPALPNDRRTRIRKPRATRSGKPAAEEA